MQKRKNQSVIWQFVGGKKKFKRGFFFATIAPMEMRFRLAYIRYFLDVGFLSGCGE
jgi:hypothetical protein